MGWFAWQSALFILAAFALGVLVGYWFWRIQWRRVAFTESEAVTVISRRHEKAISARDTEIHRLRGLLAGGTLAATGEAAESDAARAAAVDGADVAAAAGSDPAAVDGADVAAGTTTAALVDGEVEGGIDVPPVADAEIDVPQSAQPSGRTVVDVTDGAVAAADADPDAARVVAQLPTQGGGEPQPVIDLASLESGADGTTAEGEAATAAAPETPDPGTAGDEEAAGAPASADGGPATDGPGDGSPAGEATPDDGSTSAPVAAGLVSADLTAAEDGVADEAGEDDLERIEGIGPRIASALRTAGIRSFRRLADTDVPALQAALEAAGLRFAPSLPTWSRQARFLADGDEVGFIKLTESLVAGREPGRSR